ncbi:MAG TPA: GNAT family N-acetyltransferase [Gammaproteobacteria bacterium]|nr:GNAT family N-acetyltransferase [Gammaproteobacteria bacterium]
MHPLLHLKAVLLIEPGVMQIRPAATGDLDTIVSFNRRLAEETENIILDEAVLARGVKALLDDQDKGRYYIATNEDSEILGQLMITFEWSDWRNGMIWWLQSVYVEKAARRQGVFSALVNEIRRLASVDADVCGIRLYVEKNNQYARETYHATGFDVAGYDVMEWMKPAGER